MINSKIFKIASNNKFYGLKNIYTHKSITKNSKCGDKIKIEVIMQKKKIISIRYETESCLLCEASASILANKIKLFTINDINQDIKILNKIVKKKGFILPIKFKVFKDLINKDNLSRFECIMLPFKGLIKALEL
tara:strand:+ start:60 stop:461 length:402 start_codon:yes stop_codon:yes gene_type:complete